MTNGLSMLLECPTCSESQYGRSTAATQPCVHTPCLSPGLAAGLTYDIGAGAISIGSGFCVDGQLGHIIVMICANFQSHITRDRAAVHFSAHLVNLI